MKTKFIFIIFFIFIGIKSKAQTGVFVPQLASFDTAMLNLMNTYNVPGGQLAITYKGRLVYNRGFGLADTTLKDSVYPNNLFRIASVSKTVTSLACMKLFEEGLLDLDAKVFGSNGILNDAMYQNILDPLDTLITVRMLLHHSGGWDRNITLDPMFDAYNIATTLGVSSPPTPSQVIQYVLANKMLDFTPGTQSQYSNFGYCVLGRVIEKITGKGYEDYVTDDIFTPLGITDIKLGFNLPANKLANEVNYYDYPGAPLANSVYDNSTPVAWPYGGFSVEFMDAHGGWVATSKDLLKLVCAFDRFATRPDILSNTTIDTMTKPSPHDPNYACGIGVNTYNNWWHLGSLPGTTAEIVRNGNNQLNWAILLNSRDQHLNINTAVDGLVWNILPSITSWPTFDLFSEDPSGLNENSITSELSFYPNPTTGNIFLNNIGTSKILRFEILNSLGQKMKNVKIDGNIVYTQDLPKGLYFINIRTDKANSWGKFIKN
ncbi:MAG TPA: serine hydrolase [Edaphocola sp.]|nr:serine hydrolase [Edaphocola sp.]